jgi:3-deoxy-D-manno-octulosonic-acid transferase
MIRAFLAYGFYRLVLAPLALMVLALGRPFWSAKIREMLSERDHTNWTPLLTRPIWIHASSGEIEYAKSVIRELKAKYPELPLLVTYFSPSAKRLLKNFAGPDLMMPLPWDSPFWVQKFLNFYKPRVGLFARTDVWPTFATEAHKQDIPLLLFAATLSDDSGRTRGLGAWLSRWSFSKLSAIFCVSKEDERNFLQLSSDLNVTVAGDTRFDQVQHRLQTVSSLPSTLMPAVKDFVFVAGSTWPEDEDVLLPVLPELTVRHVRVILVPHEISIGHLQDIEARLSSRGLSSVRFSLAKSWTAPDILIVDQVGILADVYRWGNVAFVGGSFKEKVHSVMEPLAAGLPVLVGPYHQNNREALQFQGIKLSNGDTAVRQVDNGGELKNKIFRLQTQWQTQWQNQWQTDRQNGPAIKPELAGVVREFSGATARVVVWVETKLGLPKSSPV